MPLRTADADILAFPADVLVNPVNCVGVAGRGLALQFRHARPDNHRAYVDACRRGLVAPRRPHVHIPPDRSLPIVVNLATKRHWRNPSRYEDVRAGVEALAALVRRHRWRSLAVPPLGCGLGGLPRPSVFALLQAVLAPLPADIVVCDPGRPVDRP